MSFELSQNSPFNIFVRTKFKVDINWFLSYLSFQAVSTCCTFCISSSALLPSWDLYPTLICDSVSSHFWVFLFSPSPLPSSFSGAKKDIYCDIHECNRLIVWCTALADDVMPLISCKQVQYTQLLACSFDNVVPGGETNIQTARPTDRHKDIFIKSALCIENVKSGV